jgi:hypothetical protein
VLSWQMESRLSSEEAQQPEELSIIVVPKASVRFSPITSETTYTSTEGEFRTTIVEKITAATIDDDWTVIGVKETWTPRDDRDDKIFYMRNQSGGSADINSIASVRTFEIHHYTNV